jgi:hypothetical protein
VVNNNPNKPATLDDVVAMLQKGNELLEEATIWLRAGSYDKVKKLLQDTLDTPEKKLAYHSSDGKTTREVGVICNVDFTTIAKYWKAWYKAGLMKSIPVKGGGERNIRNFDLKDFGIEIPKIAPKQQPPTQLPKDTEVLVQHQMGDGNQ